MPAALLLLFSAPALIQQEVPLAPRLLAHIRELASDRFEGRGPGTRGEELTVAYLVEQFRAQGLQPGNPDGTWIQEVPLMGFTSKPTLRFWKGEQAIELATPAECVALSRWFDPVVDLPKTEVVFVGYGVEAPEYAWDDYKGVDVAGKVLVMLVNDPPVADPSDEKQLDENAFRGRAMTYYGRWTYKYEMAAKKRARAVFLVHEDEAAGYPFGVVQNSWGHENFDLEATDGNHGRARVEAWLRRDVAERLLRAGGHELEELKRAAARRDFRPVVLAGLQAEGRVENTLRRVRSRNVAARLPGTTRAGECVVYSAHWDHLGIDPALSGDQVFNGAVDNASGLAGLLELARLFKAQQPRPSRSVVFLAVTAEEKGLLGSRWYVEHPLWPLEQTLCNINMDSLNPFGRTRDLISVGKGHTSLDAILERLAHEQGRVVRGDTQPEKGFYYRSDHFEFAKQGVPAIYADSGEELIGQPAGSGRKRWEEYTAQRYHKPADELTDDWDLSGAAEDLVILFRLGLEVAEAETWPWWKSTSEFRAVREAMLARKR